MTTGTPNITDNDAMVCGRIAEIREPEGYGANGRSKQVLVIETSGKWVQTVPIEFHNKMQDLLRDLAPDDVVRVACHVNGRRWNDKVFLSLTGWKVVVLAHGTPPLPQEQAKAATSVPTPPPPASDEPQEQDNLPF